MNDDFELTAENYYSDEANWKYMSVHQYLDFEGHMGVKGCEERALARLKGEYKEEPTLAQLVGSYVDAHFEGTLPQFKIEHPECFTQKGELKAAFKQAEKMIARCEADEFFMQTMSGEKQKIMTGYLFGCEWKIKIDSYLPDVAIVDLKTSSNIHESWTVKDYGKVSFVEYWGYTLQGAIYQKIVELNTGKKLPFYISVVTKEDSPEIAVIGIDQMTLDHALNEIEMHMGSVLAVKNGEAEPIPCGKCDRCKATIPLTGPISMNELFFDTGELR